MDALDLSSLPPGFGFRPTDAELITCYLKNKILGKIFENEAIPLVDIYKHEPWELPAQCNIPTREAKWYYFSYGSRKYSKGIRRKRATRAGFWKSTGKDRGIKHQNRIVGNKKTLVFHEGRPPVRKRPPVGKRPEWIMHEYSVNDKEKKDSYVLCCVTFRGIWDPVHGFGLNAPNSVQAPSNSVHAPSNSVESEEEARFEELIDPNYIGSPIHIALNSVDMVGSGAILEANQEAINPGHAPETYEDPDLFLSLEEFMNILEPENQNNNAILEANQEAVNSGHAPETYVEEFMNILESENQNNNAILEANQEAVNSGHALETFVEAFRNILESENQNNNAILETNQEAVNSGHTPETYEDPDHFFSFEEFMNILESENQNNGAILEANQEPVNLGHTPGTYEDLDHFFPSEECMMNILESENQNTDIFKDLNIDTDIFIDQHDNMFSLMENHEFTQSNHYNSEEETEIEVWQREPEPSSFDPTATSTVRLKLQANKLEKRSNNEPISEFFNANGAVNRVHSRRVKSETKVQNTKYKSGQSTFVNCFFMCAFITAVVAIVCYFRMRNARVYSLS